MPVKQNMVGMGYSRLMWEVPLPDGRLGPESGRLDRLAKRVEYTPAWLGLRVMAYFDGPLPAFASA